MSTDTQSDLPPGDGEGLILRDGGEKPGGPRGGSD